MSGQCATDEPTYAECRAVADCPHWAIYADPFFCSCGFTPTDYRDQADSQDQVEMHAARAALIAARKAMK